MKSEILVLLQRKRYLPNKQASKQANVYKNRAFIPAVNRQTGTNPLFNGASFYPVSELAYELLAVTRMLKKARWVFLNMLLKLLDLGRPFVTLT